MARSPRDEGKDRAPIPGAMEYAGAGLQFALTLLLFLWLGNWLDGKLGTGPWLLMLGVLVGFGAGLYAITHRLPRGGGGRKEER